MFDEFPNEFTAFCGPAPARTALLRQDVDPVEARAGGRVGDVEVIGAAAAGYVGLALHGLPDAGGEVIVLVSEYSRFDDDCQ